MVMNQGVPEKDEIPKLSSQPFYLPLEGGSQIRIPKVTSFAEYTETDWPTTLSDLAVECIKHQRTPTSAQLVGSQGMTDILETISANINACRDPTIDVNRLISFIRLRTRLNLEQAAAAVVSAFVAEGRIDDAARLLHEMRGVLGAAQCWLPDLWVLQNRVRGEVQAFEGLARKTAEWCAKAGVSVPLPGTYTALVPLLLRIRRARPNDRSKGLYVPEWMIKKAGIEAPEYLKKFWAEMRGTGAPDRAVLQAVWPTVDKQSGSEEPIVFSKKMFNVMQRCLFHKFHFWDPKQVLAHEVRDMESEVLFTESWIKGRLRESEDVAQIAFWFFSFIRRFQLKVVSNISWNRFLGKGEGQEFYQNNIRIMSTFEAVLADIAGQSGRDTLATGDDTLKQIDRTCMLMKNYVDVYGAGRKERLVFTRGVRGGSGRGNVDLYNLLCDILVELRNRGKDEGIEKLPGKVYKFLAKDIMHWHNAWADDAFAGDKVHGWELWIVERKLVDEDYASAGLLLQEPTIKRDPDNATLVDYALTDDPYVVV
jgi:pentatricopeptide repeat protein